MSCAVPAGKKEENPANQAAEFQRVVTSLMFKSCEHKGGSRPPDLKHGLKDYAFPSYKKLGPMVQWR